MKEQIKEWLVFLALLSVLLIGFGTAGNIDLEIKQTINGELNK